MVEILSEYEHSDELYLASLSGKCCAVYCAVQGSLIELSNPAGNPKVWPFKVAPYSLEFLSFNGVIADK